MSLFSDTDPKNLTPTLAKTVDVGNGDGEAYAIFRLLSLSVILSLLMSLTVVSIFVVRLHPSPPVPGTQTGQQNNSPRFVQVLDTLRLFPGSISSLNESGGRDLYDSRI